MKQELIKELKRAFEAPAPLHKKAFLRTLEQTKISMPVFVLSQIGYIRRWIWIISVLIFVISMVEAARLSAETVWVISALMPLLALTVVSESGRSENCEMAELEMATRFSLRSVTLARLGILGAENLIILSLLLPIEIWRQGLGVLQAGVYILLPYLMMTFVGLSIVRRIRGREAVYICVGIAVCISFLVITLHSSTLQLYQAGDFVWWTVILSLLCIGTARQCAGIVRGTAAV
ncbi:MAG: hypothetical protein K2N95_13825 [Lachnospiraceae bacterium]|nr:hypothetical protein [Lachnospiraceae bacterium]